MRTTWRARTACWQLPDAQLGALRAAGCGLRAAGVIGGTGSPGPEASSVAQASAAAAAWPIDELGASSSRATRHRTCLSTVL